MAKSKLIRRVPSNIPPRGPFANANLQVVEQAVNDIDDSNVAANANIQRSKLADTEPHQVSFRYALGAPFLVGSTAKVVGLNADQVDGRDAGMAGGLATLDGAGKLVQDATTLNGKRFFSFAAAVPIPAGATKGVVSVTFDGILSVDLVCATVQSHDLADAERPFDLALSGVSTTGCSVNAVISAAAAAARNVNVALLVYGT